MGVPYLAASFAILPRTFIPATAETDGTGLVPEIKRMGLPISVERPIASSRAFIPAISLVFSEGIFGDRNRIKSMRKAKKYSIPSSPAPLEAPLSSNEMSRRERIDAVLPIFKFVTVRLLRGCQIQEPAERLSYHRVQALLNS